MLFYNAGTCSVCYIFYLKGNLQSCVKVFLTCFYIYLECDYGEPR